MAEALLKQVYVITYPTGMMYIGTDCIASFRYFGSPNMPPRRSSSFTPTNPTIRTSAITVGQCLVAEHDKV